MKTYLNLLQYILDHGKDRQDRTGVGTRGVFGYQWRHNLAEGFPLLTTKHIHFRSVVHELLWFLEGSTNVMDLQKHGVRIWNEWADENGDLGPIYGKQWRSWEGRFGSVDQVANLILGLRKNPFSRRHIVSAWNAADVPLMKLPPCHTVWQCYVDGGRLSLHLYARSIDSFLGLPFNIASYALLVHLLAKVTSLLPGDLVISFGDLHIYSNHMEQVQTQLARVPRELPTLNIREGVHEIADFKFDDIQLIGYNPHAKIAAEVAV